MAAARLAFDSRHCALEEVAIEEALILQDAQARELQLILTPPDENTTKFKIYSLRRNESDQKEIWSLHVSGTIRLSGKEAAVQDSGSTGLDELRKRCAGELDTECLLSEAERSGDSVWRGIQERRRALAWLTEKGLDGYALQML